MFCEETTWRVGLKKYFGASSCGKWRQLSADVHCVALGLKPAYLLDTLQPDPSRFCSLLNHVLSAGAVSDDELQQRKGVKWWRELRIVSVESDVLLVNWTAIQDLFQNCLFSRVYVNIGRSGSPPDSAVDRTDAHISIECSPGIEEKCQQWYSELSATEHTETDPISPSSDGRGIALKCLSVALPPDLNVCTLFGRLLGYPVVYWFPPAGQYSLDMVELVNYRVAVSSTSHSLGTPTPHTMKDHQFYSFSVPSCVVAATRDTVWAWFQRLNEKAATLGLELILTDAVASLPSVAL